MSEIKTSFDGAYDAFQSRSEQAPAWVKDFRRQSFADFSRLGLPTRKNEDWKYTSLRTLTEREFTLSADAGAVDQTVLQSVLGKDDIAIVFIDGLLSTSLSRLVSLPVGLKVLPITDALAANADLIRGDTKTSLPSSLSAFEYLNRAFIGSSGVLVQLQAGVVVEAPLHIVHVVTKSAPKDQAVLPRHRIDLGEGAVGQIIESYVGVDDVTYLNAPVTEVSLARGAQLTYVRIQAEGSHATNIGTTRGSVATDAVFKTFALGTGARLSRFNLDIALVGERAAATLDGLYITRGEQHLDNHTLVDHAAPATKSEQVYKGILADSSRGVFNGKVKVRQSAPQSDARQLNKNLLLSSDAEIDTKPELEIDVDDVKCSHGAAIGRLDADEIFYLQSRGLDHARAERMLMGAFAEDVIQRLGAPAIQGRLLGLAKKALL